jgi:carbon-monoxide dehydrogenase medium subunit
VDDPERGIFRLVAGATEGKPVIVQEQTGVRRSMSPDMMRELLKGAGFAGDGYALNLHAAALERAYGEACAS